MTQKSFLILSLSIIQEYLVQHFSLMVEQMQMHIHSKGRPAKLCPEDQVLLCLSYWREYRTLFHVASSYALSEPTASRIVRQVEDI